MYKQYFTLLLLFLFLQIKSSAQFVASDTLVLQTKISIYHTKATLYDILNEIEEKYGINFSYANNLISLDATRSINFKEQTLEKVLDEIFKRSTITYKVIGKRVVLIKEDLTNNLVTSAAPIVPVDTNSFRITGKNSNAKEIKNVRAGEQNTEIKNNIGGFMETGKKTSKQEFSAVLKFHKYKFRRTRDSTVTWDSLLLINKKSGIKKQFYSPVMSKGDRYSLAINFMAGPSLRKLYSDNPEGKDIINQRGQETHLTGMNAEVILSYHFSSSFSIGQGVGLLKMGEEGSLCFKDADSRRRNICRDSGYYYDVYNYSNKFSYLTLPIVAGYNFYWKKFFTRFQAGLKPCVLLSKGKELEYYNYAYYFNYGNSSSWRQKDMTAPEKIAYREFNLAWAFQAEIGYRLKSISISTGLGYNRFLFSTYKNPAPLKEKRSLPGITLGLKYHF
jgi:hypothetical protein